MLFEAESISLSGSADPARLLAGLIRLREARDYARDLGRDLWDFGVEASSLKLEGMTPNDLRWLLCKGYVEHASEITQRSEDRRTFLPIGKLNICRRSCFILTPAGAEFLQSLTRELPRSNILATRTNGHAANGHAANGLAAPAAVAPAPAVRAEPPMPRWDCQRMELCVGGLIVKQYKLPAPNQEMILMAFEEEGWPHRIDDPIPPRRDHDPKRRLHDTINSLNRNQKNPLLHFLGDGSGQGVRWERANPGLNGHGAASVLDSTAP